MLSILQTLSVDIKGAIVALEQNFFLVSSLAVITVLLLQVNSVGLNLLFHGSFSCFVFLISYGFLIKDEDVLAGLMSFFSDFLPNNGVPRNFTNVLLVIVLFLNFHQLILFSRISL